ncbi:hypothetical protein CL614_03180 [archaeon]|nr:hypothetical protein [archaeon]|tara:strand:+ start:128 stop:376 length:249 start_codon:yes stop_codon:yes gene_type:complete
MPLNAKALGLAGGVLTGVCLFITTLVAAGTGYGAGLLNIFVSIYPAYDISVTGSVLGLIYGFIDGFVGLFVLAWLYNYFEKK